MDPIDFWGQRSKVKVAMDLYGNKLANTIETKPLCTLGRHVSYGGRMNPIASGGQRSKVKVTMDIYGNKLVNTIATNCYVLLNQTLQRC